MAMSPVKPGWTLADAPRIDGKSAIVTGATGGLGLETALGLARQGASTILAGRDAGKGARAAVRIEQSVAGAKVRFEMLDLASLASVERFAKRISAECTDGIDILVNNAAVMALPERQLTQDGFERQIGVNYLAHFALTAWLKERTMRCRCGGTGGQRHQPGTSTRYARAE